MSGCWNPPEQDLDWPDYPQSDRAGEVLDVIGWKPRETVEAAALALGPLDDSGGHQPACLVNGFTLGCFGDGWSTHQTGGTA